MDSHKLIIFDCDGTLLDSQDLIVQSMNDAFESEGMEPPARADTLSIVGLSLVEAMQVLIPGKSLNLQKHMALQYKQSFGEFIADLNRKEPLYDGVEKVVRRLAACNDVVLGIAAGKSQIGACRVLTEYDLSHCFVTIQTVDNAPSKPHPAMIHQTTSEAGASISDAVIIGDTTYDLEMANVAGVVGIGVDWGYHPAEALEACTPSALISYFNELKTRLHEIWGACAPVKRAIN